MERNETYMLDLPPTVDGEARRVRVRVTEDYGNGKVQVWMRGRIKIVDAEVLQPDDGSERGYRVGN